MIKMSFGEKCFKVFNGIFMIFLSLVTLYPLLYVVFASLSDSNALRVYDGCFLHPINFTAQAYTRGVSKSDDLQRLFKYPLHSFLRHGYKHRFNCCYGVCAVKKRFPHGKIHEYICNNHNVFQRWYDTYVSYR